MKKALLFLVICVVSVVARADEITFSFIAQSGGISLTANSAGLQLGPALNILVSDAQTGVAFTLPGAATANTGMSSSFTILPNALVASFDGSGANSVLITDTMGMTLVSGAMRDHASLFSTFPTGSGAFLGGFTVEFVNPAVLGMFGLGPAFSSDGGVSATFANANFGAGQLQAVVGGGTVTVETVPEAASWTLMVLGVGVMGLSFHKQLDQDGNL